MNRNAVLYAMVAGTVLRLNVGQWWDLKTVITSNQTRQQAKRKQTKAHEDLVQVLLRYQKPLRIGMAIVLCGLIVSIPTGIYHELRPSIFRRHFGFGQNQWYPHEGAQFLANPALPDRIYASNLGVASTCIFHLTPGKRVFADARLETNSKQVLQAHDDIRNLIANNGEFESLLRAEFRGDPDADSDADFDADAEQNLPMPAIILDNRALMNDSRLFHNLVYQRGWRCVFFEDYIQTFHGDEADKRAMLNGHAVFILEQQAQELGLPAADTQLLESYLETKPSTGL